MPRGYRCIFVALVGVVLAGASPPKQPDQNGAANGNETVAAADTYKPDPNRNSERCYENANHEAADLCAQWSAADAAKETAGLSYWGNWIGGFGAVLSFFSILLVLWALKQGREANEIAKDTAKRELRAYVVPTDQEVDRLIVGFQPIFRVKVKNFGQTPARELRCLCKVQFTDGDPDELPMRFRNIEGKISSVVLGPDDFHVFEYELPDALSIELLNAMGGGGVKPVFAGITCYKDVFGKRHRSTFRYFLNLPDQAAGFKFDLHACSTGNNAS
jgi:hypothetical protein